MSVVPRYSFSFIWQISRNAAKENAKPTMKIAAVCILLAPLSCASSSLLLANTKIHRELAKPNDLSMEDTSSYLRKSQLNDHSVGGGSSWTFDPSRRRRQLDHGSPEHGPMSMDNDSDIDSESADSEIAMNITGCDSTDGDSNSTDCETTHEIVEILNTTDHDNTKIELNISGCESSFVTIEINSTGCESNESGMDMHSPGCERVIVTVKINGTDCDSSGDAETEVNSTDPDDTSGNEQDSEDESTAYALKSSVSQMQQDSAALTISLFTLRAAGIVVSLFVYLLL